LKGSAAEEEDKVPYLMKALPLFDVFCIMTSPMPGAAQIIIITWTNRVF
jgi:hypothetical protein